MWTLRLRHGRYIKDPLLALLSPTLPTKTLSSSSIFLTSFTASASRVLSTAALLTSDPQQQQQQQQQRMKSSSPALLPPCCTSHPFVQRAWRSSSSSSSSSSSGGGSTSSHHRSVVPGMRIRSNNTAAASERPLPKLPLPEVKDTLSKYLSVLSTVLSPDELHVTIQHVTEFMTPGGWGDKLQAYLLKRRRETDNWAHDWWLYDMYLKDRHPLPTNVSAGLLLTKKQFSNRQQHLRHASKIVGGLLDFKSMIDSGTLPVEMADRNTRPLCMQQYYNILSSYRRPGIPSDQLITGLGKQGPPFIVVACRDQFYKVEVEQNGVTLSEGELFSQLCKVMTAAERDSPGSPPVGILTTMDRSAWAAARERLAKEPGNQENLEALENCLAMLCLDKPGKGSSSRSSTTTTPEAMEEQTAQAHHLLHADGTAFNSCNRWFDQTIQIFVSEDGTVGLNNEHSVTEAGPLFYLQRHVQAFCDSRPTWEGREEGEETRCLAEPVWLKWTTTPDVDQDIARAKDHMDRLARNVNICIRNIDEFGSEFLKSQGVSPDAFVQLAIQLTYYRMHGRMAMTYESAALRRFRKGRVDNIRANSPAALAWIQAMCGEVQATVAKKQALFQAAAEGQKKYQTEAVNGYGMDCHLIGLQEAARDLNVLDSVPLFSDPSFHKTFNFTLSTSQVPRISTAAGFYGPVAPDGYGIPYTILPDRLILVTTSFRDCAGTDSQKFITCLQSCLMEMRDSCLRG